LKEFQKIFASSSLLKYIKEFDISSSTGQLNLRLNRVAVTQAVINNVINRGKEYGTQNISDLGSCYKNTTVFILKNAFSMNNDGEFSLEYLRTVITLAYVKNILLANR
jgi:hypothetical protein